MERIGRPSVESNRPAWCPAVTGQSLTKRVTGMYSTIVKWSEGIVRLTWMPGLEPPDHLVTSVHAFCFKEGRLLLVDLKHRGWDIPGGRLNPGERPVEALRREMLEEGYVTGGPATLLGAVQVDHSDNPLWRPDGPYPKIGYQLFYRLEVTDELPFSEEYESRGRTYVAPSDAPRWHNNWNPMFDCILQAALNAC
jgi:8-oxo-dGTP diphosphatase